VKNKQNALIAGDKKYQGALCKKGHLGIRYVINADCVECAMDRQCTESRKKYLAGYRKTSIKLKKYQADYQKVYEKTEKVREVRAQYRKTHAAQWTAKTRKYQCAKIVRTPKWLTEDDIWIMEEAYVLAALRTKFFGFSWEVDHIVPLRGKLASGLHVPHNLQVIPKVENRSKSNQFTVS
jgi:hypothetical protein